MTLKIKRNLPLALLLIGILLFMSLAMGSQHITSYNLTSASVHAWAMNLTQSNLASAAAGFMGQ